MEEISQEAGDVVHLPEATALIVGLGGIGAATAKLLAAFGVRVLATDARRTAAPEGVAELHRPEALDEAAASGFRYPDGAAHAGDRRVLQSHAIREDEAECVLHQHRPRHDDPAGRSGGRPERRSEIAGAALDVFEIEPLPAEHPLWTMPNVLLTPHMAGHGPYLNDRRYDIMAENCRRFAAGKDLMNEVDKAVWF